MIENCSNFNQLTAELSCYYLIEEQFQLRYPLNSDFLYELCFSETMNYYYYQQSATPFLNPKLRIFIQSKHQILAS